MAENISLEISTCNILRLCTVLVSEKVNVGKSTSDRPQSVLYSFCVIIFFLAWPFFAGYVVSCYLRVFFFRGHHANQKMNKVFFFF